MQNQNKKTNAPNHPKWLPDGSQDHFRQKVSPIFTNFWVPSGTPKGQKNMEGSELKGLGSHLVATLGGSAHVSRCWLRFWSILVPFWVALAPFSNHFGSWLCHFLNFCFGCFVVGFLGSSSGWPFLPKVVLGAIW